MLKKTLAGAAALTLMASSSAFAAPSASSAVTINGSVADTCTLTLGAASTADNNASFASNTISITALANATDATSQAAGTTLSFDGMCNYAHDVSLQSANGGLTHDGSVSVVGGAFDDNVEYDVTANWSTGVSLDAEGGAQVTSSESIGGANAQTGATIVFNFDNNSGTDPLLSGAYTDTVTIQLGASL